MELPPAFLWIICYVDLTILSERCNLLKLMVTIIGINQQIKIIFAIARKRGTDLGISRHLE